MNIDIIPISTNPGANPSQMGALNSLYACNNDAIFYQNKNSYSNLIKVQVHNQYQASY